MEEELCVTFRLLLAVDRVLARYSPVAIIQRWVRGWLVRRALLKNGNDKIRYIPPHTSHLTLIYSINPNHIPHLTLTC